MPGYSRKGDGHWARPPQSYRNSTVRDPSPSCVLKHPSYTNPARVAAVSPSFSRRYARSSGGKIEAE